jgi:hypothetical protein
VGVRSRLDLLRYHAFRGTRWTETAFFAVKSHYLLLTASLTKSAKFNLLYDSEHPTSFGTFVADYLRATGKSIIGLAGEIGVSKQALFNWMNASSLPTSKHAVNIMQVMQCSSIELVKALEDNFQYPKLKMLEELKEA